MPPHHVQSLVTAQKELPCREAAGHQLKQDKLSDWHEPIAAHHWHEVLASHTSVLTAAVAQVA
jgi:hypothetical protein